MSSGLWEPVNWDRVTNLTPSDFQYPGRMDRSIIEAFSALSILLVADPVVIDDYRIPGPGSTSQHCFGRAIDFVVPGVDSLQVLSIIEKSKLFSGYGLYTNEKGVESFHVDTRTTRTVNNPATWGAWKDRGAGVTSWQYVGLSNIVAKISKGAGFAVIVLIGIALYVLTNK